MRPSSPSVNEFLCINSGQSCELTFCNLFSPLEMVGLFHFIRSVLAPRRVLACLQLCSVMSDPCNPMDCSPRHSCAHGIFQTKILKCCHICLQGIFPTKRQNPRSPQWQVDSLPLNHLRSPLRVGVMTRTSKTCWSIGGKWTGLLIAANQPWGERQRALYRGEYARKTLRWASASIFGFVQLFCCSHKVHSLFQENHHITLSLYCFFFLQSTKYHLKCSQ